MVIKDVYKMTILWTNITKIKMMEEKMGDILGYARVSTNQQDLEVQRQRLKK